MVDVAGAGWRGVGTPAGPGSGQVLVEVKTAAINPGEAAIRAGAFAQRWPAMFPSGQGSDLAGIVAEVGPGVTRVMAGDEVIGFTDNRASHAQFVLVEQGNLTPRPSGVPWEAAGSLYVAGTTAYAAVRAVSLAPGDTLVVSAAAGGVGSIAVQLATAAGATVIGLAGPANHDWLAGHGVIPVVYGDGVSDRIRDASGGRVDAFLDAFGGGYVDLAIDLGVRPERIDTVIDFAAAERYAVKTDGNAAAGTAEVLAEVAALIDKGVVEIPIAKVFPLAEVRDAYRELERRHTRGKIVLRP
ncbi:NADP-dependent oxidoreductase [Pseudofrankia sp. BMG5.36]|uniref:NADP-dependent oxidoreductase n=1 Tax=Pseudofrankia sp. BMG5.36 TaxID=1834512 RepID=UPI0008D90AC5|nr:NADP-dependent oxidoreductase [Pseudofrankia sp. BMG5.36]OHV45733.1 NADPH:quinone reductase [Pseudofrankia sp. BMG5.36]